MPSIIVPVTVPRGKIVKTELLRTALTAARSEIPPGADCDADIASVDETGDELVYQVEITYATDHFTDVEWEKADQLIAAYEPADPSSLYRADPLA